MKNEIQTINVEEVKEFYEDLHITAGLVRTDDDDEGQPQYIGHKRNWQLFEELSEEYENK